MKTPFRPVLIFLFAAALGLQAADPAAQPRKKILFYSESQGFEHDGIKTDGKPGHGFAFRVMHDLAAKNNWDITESKDGSLFTPEYVAQFDLFLFYVTGDLTGGPNRQPSHDGQPLMTPAGKDALLRAIAGGKAFVGVHSATDAFHSNGRNNEDASRYERDANVDPYIRMIGGEFIKHDAQQKAHQIVADAKFPGLSAVPADFAPLEEWYSLKNIAPDLHVLLVQDTTGMKGPSYQRAPYPATWARMEGKGRVFYTSMGHREDVWDNPVFQSVLTGGINWALGRVDADVTPNLAQAAPHANEIQKYAPPPPREKKSPDAKEKK